MPAAPSLTGPPAPVTTLGGAFGQVGLGGAGRAAASSPPYALAAAAPAAGNALVFAIIVDGGSAATSAFFDDMQEYVRTHNVNLGPFNFIKSDF